jgi:hypothetical protein
MRRRRSSSVSRFCKSTLSRGGECLCWYFRSVDYVDAGIVYLIAAHLENLVLLVPGFSQ